MRLSRLTFLRPAAVALLILLLTGTGGWSLPPEYESFGRPQRADYAPRPEDLLRIWVVYVDQGDGILIQLPERHNYDPAGTGQRTERIDVLIDGGSNPRSEAERMRDFIRRLYGGTMPVIEHAVITHHDMDHIAGLIHLMEQGDATLEVVHQNGLASYRRGRRGFPAAGRPDRPAVYDFGGGVVRRGMAFLDANGAIDPGYLLDGLQALRNAHDRDELEGVYEELGAAILGLQAQGRVRAFQRAHAGAPFIGEWEAGRGRNIAGIRFELLWPLRELRPYGGTNWGETVNGNSVTFRLVYGDFQMLFTGDHNEHSEQAFLQHLRQAGQEGLLDCDVLKVPHHGSSHAHQPFFDRGARGPVISVASMGNQGFRSRAMTNAAWQHPSTDVVSWLGGAHRVYHTFIHERRFTYADIDTEERRQRMIERSHILVETDGQWFRVVEIDADTGDPRIPPTVQATRRGNGTRWIRAREN